MKKSSKKYDIDDPCFDQEHQVLKNKLGIIDQYELENAETNTLISAYDKLALEFSELHSFTVEDILYIHKTFLQDIFEWAGEYRRVDISSSDIHWCHAAYIEKEMKRFEKLLSHLTPLSPLLERDEIIDRVSQVHGELIIIHPFRDGNGRTARLLCDLMLMQANIQPIKAVLLYDGEFRKRYHEAIQRIWLSVDYTKLRYLLSELIF